MTMIMRDATGRSVWTFNLFEPQESDLQTCVNTAAGSVEIPVGVVGQHEAPSEDKLATWFGRIFAPQPHSDWESLFEDQV